MSLSNIFVLVRKRNDDVRDSCHSLSLLNKDRPPCIAFSFCLRLRQICIFQCAVKKSHDTFVRTIKIVMMKKKVGRNNRLYTCYKSFIVIDMTFNFAVLVLQSLSRDKIWYPFDTCTVKSKIWININLLTWLNWYLPCCKYRVIIVLSMLA